MAYRIFPLEGNFVVGTDLPTVGDVADKSLFTLDADTVAEVFRMELIGPVTGAGVREKLEYVVPTMGGETFDDIHPNELMLPPNAMETSIHAIDLGKPLLLGGTPLEASRCPKFPPSSVIGVQVKVPSAADGGVIVASDFKVRLMVVEATGDDIERVLSGFDTVVGGDFIQDVEIRDREEGESFSIAKRVTFDKTKFGELYGGQSVTKPRVKPIITYGQNSAATTPNEAYELRKTSDQVSKSWMDLYWNLGEKEVVAIDKIGVLPHTNMAEIELNVSERAKQVVWKTPLLQNIAPMPLNPDANIKMQFGPMTAAAYSGNTFLHVARHKIFKITMKDNGTLIPAWVAGTPGAMIGVWGYKMEDVTVS